MSDWYDRPMTYGETFMAIREGEWRIALAFGLECLIMASPIVIVGLAVWLC